jgi:hypothetical protein
MNTSKERPIHEVRIGLIKAAVWRNEASNGALRYNVTFCRLYREDERWKTTESFGRDDLLVVAKVADRAHTWIIDQAPERDQAQPAQPDLSPQADH